MRTLGSAIFALKSLPPGVRVYIDYGLRVCVCGGGGRQPRATPTVGRISVRGAGASRVDVTRRATPLPPQPPLHNAGEPLCWTTAVIRFVGGGDVCSIVLATVERWQRWVCRHALMAVAGHVCNGGGVCNAGGGWWRTSPAFARRRCERLKFTVCAHERWLVAGSGRLHVCVCVRAARRLRRGFASNSIGWVTAPASTMI